MMLWRRAPPPPLLLLKKRSTSLRSAYALCFRSLYWSSVPGESLTEEPKRCPSRAVISRPDTLRGHKLSYHKFNESQREQTVLRRLKRGEVVALISDAGKPGSDPGTELAKLCIKEDVTVIPIPVPLSLVAALSASGLTTDEFTFVGFLSKHTGSRRERLVIANDSKTKIFYVTPHKLQLFLEETSSIFGDSRQCVIAREITKLQEEFWRGSLGEAKQVFSTLQPKGEITVLIEGKANSEIEMLSEIQFENEHWAQSFNGSKIGVPGNIHQKEDGIFTCSTEVW